MPRKQGKPTKVFYKIMGVPAPIANKPDYKQKKLTEYSFTYSVNMSGFNTGRRY